MIEETISGQAQPEFKAPPHRTVESEIEKLLKCLVVDVFSTPQGMKLLELWEDIYLRQITWKPGVPAGFGEFRAGQNQVVLSIRAILNEAKTGTNK